MTRRVSVSITLKAAEKPRISIDELTEKLAVFLDDLTMQYTDKVEMSVYTSFDKDRE